MNLHRTERDWYVVTAEITPPLEGDWEASFDDAETWIDGTETTVEVDGEDVIAWSWLVFGPDFVPADVGMSAEGVEIPTSLTPRLRLKDNPVVDIPKGVPSIRLWGEPAD